MKKIQMLVQGNVQGVGFRYMTKMIADELDVKGTVANQEDGSVFIEAFGSNETIDAFVERIKQSPALAAKVSHVDVISNAFIHDYQEFTIIY